MMAAKSAIIPVHELMREENEPFDPTVFIPAVAGYYTDSTARCCRSVQLVDPHPLLQQGPVPRRQHRRQLAPEDLAGGRSGGAQLLAARHSCGFTTDWPSWINVENFSALHNVPIATNANGFGASMPS